MAETKIEWADYTFNHVRGCTKVSAECDNCYAETLAGRNPKTLGIWGKYGQRSIAAESYWKLPVKWNRIAETLGERKRVFCASLADVFEGDSTMPDNSIRPVWDARERLFHLIADTPKLDWLLLTKRPNFVKSIMVDLGYGAGVDEITNVWLGTSVGEKKAKDRIDILRDIPANIRFLSIEPLLEDLGELDLTGIHWVIVGGESGGKARPMHPDWVRSIRDQCIASNVPFLFKQWGQWEPQGQTPGGTGFGSGIHYWEDASDCRVSFQVGKIKAGRLLDGRTWDELPK